MWTLFRSECYQLLRSKSFYASILISGIVFILFYNSDANVRTIAELRDATGTSWNLDTLRKVCYPVLHQQFGMTEQSFTELDDMMSIYFKYVFSLRVFADFNGFLITSTYLSTVLLGTSFEHRTIDISIAQGYSRKQIFWVKAILYYFVALCNSLLWYSVLYLYTFGPQGASFLPDDLVLKAYLTIAFFVIVMYAVPFLISMLTRNILKSAILNFGFLFITIFINIVFSFQVYSVLLPFFCHGYFLRAFGFPEYYQLKPLVTILILLSSAVYLIGCNWLAYRVFQKAELK